MTDTMTQPQPTTETISAAKERRERKKNSRSPGQRRPRAIDELTDAESTPDLTRTGVEHLTFGTEYGWLTVLGRPETGFSPVLCRCRCGAKVRPIAQHVADSRVRFCGNSSLHGRF